MSRDEEYRALAGTISEGLLGRALLLTGNWHTAEDLTQETLARVYASWSRLRRDGNPTGYAYTTLYRLAIDRRRRHSSGELADGTVPAEAHAPQDAPPVDQHLDLARALDSLAPEERFLVVARYLDDQPVADVAQLMGRSEAWVRTTSSRVLKRLRQHPALATSSA